MAARPGSHVGFWLSGLLIFAMAIASIALAVHLKVGTEYEFTNQFEVISTYWTPKPWVLSFPSI